MTHHNVSEHKTSESGQRVFVSKARVVSEEERQSLTDSEKAFEASCSDPGVWLELFCPDGACLKEEEKIEVPVFCKDSKTATSLWFRLFCPDGSCEATAPSSLP